MGDEGEQRPAGENLENGRAPAGPGEASSLSQTSQWGGAEVEAGPRPERGKGSRVKMGNEVSCDQSQASLLGSRGPAKGGVLLSPKLQAEAGQNSLGRAMGRINRAREPPPSLSPSSQLGQEGGGGVSSLSTGHIGRPFQDPSPSRALLLYTHRPLLPSNAYTHSTNQGLILSLQPPPSCGHERLRVLPPQGSEGQWTLYQAKQVLGKLLGGLAVGVAWPGLAGSGKQGDCPEGPRPCQHAVRPREAI